jgi:hypothetical protein
MGLMAHRAFGNKAVLSRMAIPTSHIGLVLTGEAGHLFGNRGMAGATDFVYILHGDGQRFMRIFMALKTWGKHLVFPVKCPARGTLVAPGAVRHDLGIVIFSRAVDMILSVTADTIDLMLAPFLFNGLKNGKVALTALHRR